MPHPKIEIRRLDTVPDDVTHEDAAAISAGFKSAYTIAIVSPAGVEMIITEEGACYVAAPDMAGTYGDPRYIRDLGLRQLAADVWAWEIDGPGSVGTVRTGIYLPHEGQQVRVSRLEFEEGEDGSLATGYLYAAPHIGAPNERYHITDLTIEGN